MRVLLGMLVGLLLAGCAATEEKTTLSSANPPMTTGPMARPPAHERVRLTTSEGTIVLDLDREAAPVSVANFLGYVERGEYDGTLFHRVIENFVVQGGGYNRAFEELPSRGVIRNEWQNGLKNVRGTIAMARETAPDTATRQFFINVVDNPKLDTGRDITGGAGYAVFGRVVEGMDVADRIRKAPTGTSRGMENVPLEPVVLLKAERVN